MSLNPIDYYDAKKWDIDESRGLLQREHKAIKSLHATIAKAKSTTLLDIGCGDGLFLDQLYRQLPDSEKPKVKLHGVDYSEYKLKKARKLKLPAKFAWCNLEKEIPYPARTFDVVYSGEVIEHIYNPDFMLEECARVLKKGGILMISTPNLQSWYNRVLFLFGVQPLFYETSTKSSMVGAGIVGKLKKGNIPVGHLRVFNRTALSDLLVQEGFEIIDFQGARFQSLPQFVQRIDNLFNIRPSLASNLIVTARKK